LFVQIYQFLNSTELSHKMRQILHFITSVCSKIYKKTTLGRKVLYEAALKGNFRSLVRLTHASSMPSASITELRK
jgi:hypothetical protein